MFEFEGVGFRVQGKVLSHTVEHDPFIKSPIAPRNQLYGLRWCKFGHVTVKTPNERNPRKPPCGENNYFKEMCSGSEAGSCSRRIDCVYHSTLGLRVIKKIEGGD